MLVGAVLADGGLIGRSAVAHGLTTPEGGEIAVCRGRSGLVSTLEGECGPELSQCVGVPGFVSGCVRWLTFRTNPLDTRVLFSMDE